MDTDDPRLKTWGIVLGVVVCALALVDFVVLRGEQVASTHISLRANSEPGFLEVSRVGEEHRVLISTRKNTVAKGKGKGRAISWRLIGPDGATIDEDSEILAHEKRYFDFVPMQQGPYALHVEEAMILLGDGRGTANAFAYVGDRRILSPLLGF